MTRRLPPNRRLGRARASKDPGSEIWIFCEGDKTEPRYLKEFVRDHRAHLVRVIEIVGAAGVPATLVDTAADKVKELKRRARRSKDSFDRFFEVWGVLDVDTHPNLNQACGKARECGVGLAISNPCFELWALLHFGDWDRPDTSKRVQGELYAKVDAIVNGNRKILNYATMRHAYGVAHKRAVTLCQRRKDEGNPIGNPSTNVFQLLESILRRA